jgi:hypothetical protein
MAAVIDPSGTVGLWTQCLDPFRAVAVAARAVANVIVVAADDNILSPELWIAPLDDAEHVTAVAEKRLKVGPVVACRLELVPLKLSRKIQAGRAATAATRLAPFERVVSEDFDVPLELRGLD